MIKEWLDFIASAAIAGLAFIFLFEGVRLLRSFGYSRAALWMVAFGVIYCLGLAGFSFWIHGSIRDSEGVLKRARVTDVPLEKWGLELEAAKREEATRALARMAFVDSGKLVDFIDQSGQRKPFVPTEQDVKDRDFYVVTQARLNDAAADNLRKSVGWLVWAILAVMLGFIFGSNRANKPANPPVEADARESGARGSP